MILTQYRELQAQLFRVIQSKDLDAPRIADMQKMVCVLASEFRLDALQCTQELLKCISKNGSFCESRALLWEALRTGLSLQEAGEFVRNR